MASSASSAMSVEFFHSVGRGHQAAAAGEDHGVAVGREVGRFLVGRARADRNRRRGAVGAANVRLVVQRLALLSGCILDPSADQSSCWFSVRSLVWEMSVAESGDSVGSIV
jgi:hypothetical protein